MRSYQGDTEQLPVEDEEQDALVTAVQNVRGTVEQHLREHESRKRKQTKISGIPKAARSEPASTQEEGPIASWQQQRGKAVRLNRAAVTADFGDSEAKEPPHPRSMRAKSSFLSCVHEKNQ